MTPAENRLSNTAVPYALQDFFEKLSRHKNRIDTNISVVAFRNLSEKGEVLIQIETRHHLGKIKVAQYEFKQSDTHSDFLVVSTLEEETTVLAALKAFNRESAEYYPPHHQQVKTKDFEIVRYLIDKDNLLTAFLFKTKHIDRFTDYQKSFKNTFLHQQDTKRKDFIKSNFELFFSNPVFDFDVFRLFSLQLTADDTQQLDKIITQINHKMTIGTVFTTLENFCSELWSDLHFMVDYSSVSVLDTNKIDFSFINNEKRNITFLGKHNVSHTINSTNTKFRVELNEEAKEEIKNTFDLFQNDRFASTQMHCQKIGTFKNTGSYPFKNREYLLIFSNDNDIRIYFVFDKEEENKDDINALLSTRERFLRDNYQILVEKENGNRLVFEALRYTIKSPYLANRLAEIGTKAVNIESLQKEEPKLIEKIKELENILFTETEN